MMSNECRRVGFGETNVLRRLCSYHLEECATAVVGGGHGFGCGSGGGAVAIATVHTKNHRVLESSLVYFLFCATRWLRWIQASRITCHSLQMKTGYDDLKFACGLTWTTWTTLAEKLPAQT